jgi:hypothetical protein
MYGSETGTQWWDVREVHVVLQNTLSFLSKRGKSCCRVQ